NMAAINCRSCLFSHVKVALYIFKMCRGNERTYLCSVIHRVADNDTVHAFFKSLNKFVINIGMEEQAGIGCTRLAVKRENAPCTSIERAVKIRVIKNDDR